MKNETIDKWYRERIAMRIQELPVREFLAHLHRHLPVEIIDEACLASLKSVERQFGETISHGAGLEVRLGEEARYVDYILNIDAEDIPHVPSLWYEMDYEEYKKAEEQGTEIIPCLFANIAPDENGSYDAIRDETFPPLMGEKRAKTLRQAWDHVISRIPAGARIKQIGTMSSRGELDVMRLVILFPSAESVLSGLPSIGWTGNTDALNKALLPWCDVSMISVNIDLGPDGVLPKIGIEVGEKWRHPVLVDRFIERLVEADLCLESKAEALRRWIRLRPDGDPFIQTMIAYFKLNYRDGKITEAKAYLEQSPYPHHTYYDAYDRPVRLDLELSGKSGTMDAGTAIRWLEEFRKERGRHVRLVGAADHPLLDRILEKCAGLGLTTGQISEDDLRTESCFSPKKAMAGGPDPRKNPNRGIEKGCEAGRSFLAVRADGQPVPCLYAASRAGVSEKKAGSLTDYWLKSSELADLRERNCGPESCAACPYLRRCRPCPLEDTTNCEGLK